MFTGVFRGSFRGTTVIATILIRPLKSETLPAGLKAIIRFILAVVLIVCFDRRRGVRIVRSGALLEMKLTLSRIAEFVSAAGECVPEEVAQGYSIDSRTVGRDSFSLR